MTTYNFNAPGLAEKIAAVAVSKSHANLLQVISGVAGLEDAYLATTRGPSWYVRRKVVDAGGTLIHDNHEEWLRLQLEADGGRARITRARLRAEGYFLTKCELTTLYIVHDRHSMSQADFVQLEVYVENEFVDCQLFSQGDWCEIADLRDLMADSEGMEVKDKRQHRPLNYLLHRAIDIGLFVGVIDKVEATRREFTRSRKYVFTDVSTGRELVQTADQLSPGWDKFPSKERRMFEDWRRSSAGQSGARFCQHWVVEVTDYTDTKGERWLSLIPVWTFAQKLAKIEGGKGGVYELFGKLQKMDLRLKAPFGWYFYMLHGNKMGDVVGRRITQAAEDGLIVLPEHDYQVLASWKAHEYGF